MFGNLCQTLQAGINSYIWIDLFMHLILNYRMMLTCQTHTAIYWYIFYTTELKSRYLTAS